MIESVEKQKRILDMLNRWARNCRIKWLLRGDDLNSLSWQIIEEFYNVSLSCCHYVRDPHKEYVIETPDCDGTVIGSYCEDCGKERLKWEGAKLLYTIYDGNIIDEQGAK